MLGRYKNARAVSRTLGTVAINYRNVTTRCEVSKSRRSNMLEELTTE
jgi:hypothetical protein